MARQRRINGGLINLTISNPISEALKTMPREVERAVDKVVVDTADRIEQRIKDDTPRDRGQGGGAVSRWTKTKTKSGEVTLRNDAPQINVLEFGGYPVVPNSKNRPNATGGTVRGNATLGGYPPGPRTQIAPGGSPTMTSNVSRQAPRGVVRQNLERAQDRFVFDLEEAIDRAYQEIAERE